MDRLNFYVDNFSRVWFFSLSFRDIFFRANCEIVRCIKVLSGVDLVHLSYYYRSLVRFKGGLVHSGLKRDFKQRFDRPISVSLLVLRERCSKVRFIL